MVATLFMVLVVIPLAALWIWSGAWAYEDAESRGKPGWAVCLLVLIAWWPIGLLAWIIFRPAMQLRPPRHRNPLSLVAQMITLPFVYCWQEIRLLLGR